jgi:hypothetical protein
MVGGGAGRDNPPADDPNNPPPQNNPPPADNAQPSRLDQFIKLGTFIIAVLFLVILFIIIFNLFRRTGATEIAWQRSVYLLTGVEAIAFAAAGYLFGRDVHRGTAQEAQTRADQAMERADQETERANAAEGQRVSAEEQRVAAQEQAGKQRAVAVAYGTKLQAVKAEVESIAGADLTDPQDHLRLYGVVEDQTTGRPPTNEDVVRLAQIVNAPLFPEGTEG